MNVNISNLGVIIAIIVLILTIVFAVLGQLSYPVAALCAALAVAIILK